VKSHFSDKTIIGSGDVTDPAAAIEMIRRTGVDGVAVARAAIGNPWIFRQLEDLLAGREPRQPSLTAQRGVMAEHFARTVELYGPKRGARRMRKFGIKYARLHPTPKRVRAAFVAVKNPQDWHKVLETFYKEGQGQGEIAPTARPDTRQRVKAKEREEP